MPFLPCAANDSLTVSRRWGRVFGSSLTPSSKRTAAIDSRGAANVTIVFVSSGALGFGFAFGAAGGFSGFGFAGEASLRSGWSGFVSSLFSSIGGGATLIFTVTGARNPLASATNMT
ncbi:MAG: hypothetical protein QM811_22160 [Pirellulales bacterium]